MDNAPIAVAKFSGNDDRMVTHLRQPFLLTRGAIQCNETSFLVSYVVLTLCGPNNAHDSVWALAVVCLASMDRQNLSWQILQNLRPQRMLESMLRASVGRCTKSHVHHAMGMGISAPIREVGAPIFDTAYNLLHQRGAARTFTRGRNSSTHKPSDLVD